MKKELTAATLLGVIVSIVPSAAYTAPIAGPGVAAANSNSTIVMQVVKKTPRATTGKQQLDCW